MIVQTRQQRDSSQRRLRRGVPRAEQAEAPVPAIEGARERAADGPEDRARYQCSCGYVFDAPVSTTVGCPRCGDAQDW
jgi:cytochrome c5